jgi:hypothetical protein
MEFAMAQNKHASLLNTKFSLNKQICFIRRCILTNKPYFDHYELSTHDFSNHYDPHKSDI